MLFYCKNCGTEIDVYEGKKTAVCDFCGMEQTLPGLDDPQKLEKFVNANELRLDSRFDEAIECYKQIIAQYPDDNEAYWCKLLCEFGIEYVDDALTEKMLPTCHRTVRESIFDNKDYKLIMSRATKEEVAIYESEAKEIDRIQKDIIKVVDNEQPYDIFICFKDSDEKGRRTKDSQLANKIYTNLTNKNYKVFFSRVTLKSRGGEDYEPLIYAALSSAKIMLLVTTSVDYVNAPWVRNEWSRYLDFIKADDSKVIVPCISGMDAYDLPKELSSLQALDMADFDFIESLTRQIDSKFNRVSYAQPTPTTVHTTADGEFTLASDMAIKNHLKRAKFSIEDDEWDKARAYADKILDIDPEFYEAYLMLAFCDYKIHTIDELITQPNVLNNPNYKKAFRFSDGEIKMQLDTRRVSYEMAEKELSQEWAEDKYDEVKSLINAVQDYRDTSELKIRLEERRAEYNQFLKYTEILGVIDKKWKRDIYDEFYAQIDGIKEYYRSAQLYEKLNSRQQEYYNGIYDEISNTLSKEWRENRYNEIKSEIDFIRDHKDCTELYEKLNDRRKEYSMYLKYTDIVKKLNAEWESDINDELRAEIDSLQEYPLHENLYSKLEEKHREYINDRYKEILDRLSKKWMRDEYDELKNMIDYIQEYYQSSRLYEKLEEKRKEYIVQVADVLDFYDYKKMIEQGNYNITILENTRQIKFKAFADQAKLRSVKMPESVVKICSSAFINCINLNKVNLGRGVSEISALAFKNCKSLRHIFIPKSVKSISMEVFSGCNNLTVYCEAESKPSGWNDDWNPDNRPVVWGCSKDEYDNKFLLS